MCYNQGHNILGLFDTLQISFSPQVINMVGIYELPHDLSNDLRLRISGN